MSGYENKYGYNKHSPFTAINTHKTAIIAQWKLGLHIRFQDSIKERWEGCPQKKKNKEKLQPKNKYVFCA